MKKQGVAGVLAAFLLVGCSDNNELKIEPAVQEEGSQEIIKNEELTNQVKREEGIIDGQVYEQDGLAIGTLILKSTVSNQDAKKLAEKYASELKKQFKNQTINVQAVRDGENIANITKE